jgi:hypothetical protein
MKLKNIIFGKLELKNKTKKKKNFYKKTKKKNYKIKE